MRQRDLPLPATLVVEANTLERVVKPGGAELVSGARGMWFRAGTHIRLVAASSRPTAILYSRLLNRPPVVPAQVDGFAIKEGPIVLEGAEIDALSKGQQDLLMEFADGLREIRAQGVDILMVVIPSGEVSEDFDRAHHQALSWLSQTTRIPVWDLHGQLPREELQFTDDVHLAPTSAARVLRTIIEETHPGGVSAAGAPTSPALGGGQANEGGG